MLHNDHRDHGTDEWPPACLIAMLFKSMKSGGWGIEIDKPHWKAKVYALSSLVAGTVSTELRVVRS